MLLPTLLTLLTACLTLTLTPPSSHGLDLSFTATPDTYALTPTPSTLTSGTTYTVETSFHTSGEGTVFSLCRPSDGLVYLSLSCTPSFSLELTGFHPTTPFPVGACGPSGPSFPASTHVAVVFNGTHGVPYVDGDPVGDFSIGGGVSPTPHDVVVLLGNAPGGGSCVPPGGSAGLDGGVVGLFRLWDGERSGDAVNATRATCAAPEAAAELLVNVEMVGQGMVGEVEAGGRKIFNSAPGKARNSDFVLWGDAQVDPSPSPRLVPGMSCPGVEEMGYTTVDGDPVGAQWLNASIHGEATAIVAADVVLPPAFFAFTVTVKCTPVPKEREEDHMTIMSFFRSPPSTKGRYLALKVINNTLAIETESRVNPTEVVVCDSAWHTLVINMIAANMNLPDVGQPHRIHASSMDARPDFSRMTVPEIVDNDNYPAASAIGTLALGQNLADASGSAFVPGQAFEGGIFGFAVWNSLQKELNPVLSSVIFPPSTEDLWLYYPLHTPLSSSTRAVQDVSTFASKSFPATITGPLPEFSSVDWPRRTLVLSPPVVDTSFQNTQGKVRAAYAIPPFQSGQVHYQVLQHLARLTLYNESMVGYLSEARSLDDVAGISGLLASSGISNALVGGQRATETEWVFSDPHRTAMHPDVVMANLTDPAGVFSQLGFTYPWELSHPIASNDFTLAHPGGTFSSVAATGLLATPSLGFVVEYGNCSSTRSTGAACAPGYECCTDGSCRKLCALLLDGMDYGGHHYEVWQPQYIAAEHLYQEFAASRPYGGFSQGYLAQFGDEAEANEVDNLVGSIPGLSKYYKIDGYDGANEGVFLYTTGPLKDTLMYNAYTGESTGYVVWSGGEPNNFAALGGEHTVEVYESGSTSVPGALNDLPVGYLGRPTTLVIEWGDCVSDSTPCPSPLVCSSTSGICECPPGLAGPQCTTPCECALVPLGSPCPREGGCEASACGAGTSFPGRFGHDCASICPGGEGASACSSRGVCDDGVSGTGLCVSCDPGWTGADCSIPCACNGPHGTCQLDGSCQCDPEWVGPGCDARCPGPARNCSGHGTCVVSSGACACDTLYGGADCSSVCPGIVEPLAGSTVVLPCSGHGVCEDAVCSQCSYGYGGPECSVECPVSGENGNVCSSPNGECGDDGICVCGPGFSGLDCSVVCPGGVCENVNGTSSGNTTLSAAVGDLPEESDSGEMLRTVGTGLGVLLLVLALVLVALAAWVRRRRHSVAPVDHGGEVGNTAKPTAEPTAKPMVNPRDPAKLLHF